MQDSYKEGAAIHFGPEFCVGHRLLIGTIRMDTDVDDPEQIGEDLPI
jgi:hypothetical protein